MCFGEKLLEDDHNSKTIMFRILLCSNADMFFIFIGNCMST